MALWFDSRTGMLMTEQDIVKRYAEYLGEKVRQYGIEYILEKEEGFTLTAWMNDEQIWEGCLLPVLNAEKFKII